MQHRLYWYLLKEYLPGLLLGLGSFLFILILSQMARLLEIFLSGGASIFEMLEMIWNLSKLLLPYLIPISALFAAISTFHRLTQDSEFVSLISLGVSPSHILGFLGSLGIIFTILTWKLFFSISPAAIVRVDEMTAELSRKKIQANLKPNLFNNPIPDLILYAQQINRSGEMESVIVANMKQNPKLAISAKRGIIAVEKQEDLGSERVWLHLNQGIINLLGEKLTRIEYQTYRTKLLDTQVTKDWLKSNPATWNLDDIHRYSSDPQKKPQAKLEWHRRASLSFAAGIMSLFGGVSVLTVNRRSKTNAFVMTTFVAASYWLIITLGEAVSTQGILSPELTMWLPPSIFLILGFAIFISRFHPKLYRTLLSKN